MRKTSASVILFLKFSTVIVYKSDAMTEWQVPECMRQGRGRTFPHEKKACALFKGRNLSIARLPMRSGLLSSLGKIHAWAYSGEISFFCGFPLF